MLDNLRGWVGSKIRGLTLYVDVIDACSSRCPTCPVGVDPLRDGNRMSIETFRKILDKAQSEVKIRKVQLYRWSDPLLHPLIHEFAAECVSRGIRCSTSSDLQATNCDFRALIETRLNEFRSSFSGWKSMHIYQKGATAERFLKKFKDISHLPRYPETRWVMFFHEYKHNREEIPKAKQLAEDFGWDFVTFPATFMNYDRIVEKSYTEQDRITLSLLTETPEENIARMRRKPKATDYCMMQEKEITLDSHGRMRLCQLMGYTDKYIMGDFLTTPLSELRSRIMQHPMCPKCKAMGVGNYSLIFADPAIEQDPVAKANLLKYERERFVERANLAKYLEEKRIK